MIQLRVDPLVVRDDLRVGDMLAEGGEGRVYQLPLAPDLVYKEYRRAVQLEQLRDLVAWPSSLGVGELSARVQAASAWPAAAVAGRAGEGVGLLVPRAPRRFSVRHRDGSSRLASLSYLTSDPAHRAVAYGISLPEPASDLRIGLVYALARLLAAFEAASPSVGHGDLSTKNVLWSLQRGPEVFVIDCDNCERFGPTGSSLGAPDRRRAMTPNWDDPAVAGGTNPTPLSDRYSLALIFLRVVGAANFPIQARQRSGGDVAVDFPLPPGRMGDALLGPGAPVWDLCGRALSVADPAARPPAAAWLAPLEALLDGIGAAAVMRAVWQAQGGGAPAPSTMLAAPGPGDVSIRPVAAAPRAAPARARVSAQPAGPTWYRPVVTTAVLLSAGRPAPASPAGGLAGSMAASLRPAAPPAPFWPQVRSQARQSVLWWLVLHRRTAQRLWSRGRSGDRARALVFLALVDLAVLIAAVFVVAMVVAPVLGI